MPNGTGQEVSASHSDVMDLWHRVKELEAKLKLLDGSQDKMLVDRAAKYGPFDRHAITVEALWRIIQGGHNAGALDSVHNEGLRMILHKIGRIVTGDPFYPDSWDDIGGYAKRVADYNRQRIHMQSQSGSKQAIDPTTGEKFNPSGKIPLISEGEKDAGGGYT